jgi:hypothetical protein
MVALTKSFESVTTGIAIPKISSQINIASSLKRPGCSRLDAPNDHLKLTGCKSGLCSSFV